MIFNLFKSGNEEKPTDVKGIRHGLLQFIKQELQKAEGGEGAHIKGLSIYLNCDPAQRHVYEAAVYLDDQEKLQQEIQKISDDYALDLPPNWTLSISFEEPFPEESIAFEELNAALFVKTSKHYIKQQIKAYIKALSGETHQPFYELDSECGKYNIGRDEKAQSDEGYFRTNHIAFPSSSSNESNKYISRQHAHLEYNPDTLQFLIFADEGGVPPRNKVKVLSAKTEEVIKLHSTHIGHELSAGDQIILGESVVLEFSYKPYE
ncbi:FHA domain-containing protein [Pedobacter insulae]|uniref:FHA domain-containing protein n=1 Tax=Pedobacter insulae TaxID=414048 RepID=A0A1I2WYF8_9SPHI|nr:FHA domain-containing protein [Pedobacter insulae]SFH05767.1 hypothetical protein SAMN04489864_104344 [Pedobacter insulae]